MGGRQESTWRKDLLPQHVRVLPLSTRAPSQIQEQSYRAKQFAFPISWGCHGSRAPSPRWDPGGGGTAVFPTQTFLLPSLCSFTLQWEKAAPVLSPLSSRRSRRSARLRQNVFGKAKQEAAGIQGPSHGVASWMEGSGSDSQGFCSKIQRFSSALGTMLPSSAPQSPSGRASEGAKHQSGLRAASSSCLPQTNPETPTSPLCLSIHSPPNPAFGTHKF